MNHCISLLSAGTLSEEIPDRELITGLNDLPERHSIAVEVQNSYDVNYNGCLQDTLPCLAEGGPRAIVDGREVEGLLQYSRDKYVVDMITLLVFNLPAECRQSNEDKTL